MSIRISITFLSMLLCACSSVGVQYQSPGDSQDSAEFYGGGVYVNSFSDEGCYSGRTFVPKSIKLHAGKEVVLAYEDHPGQGLFCRVLFSFVPEKNAKYQLRTGISKEKTDIKNLFGNPIENTLCGVIVEKLGDNGAATPIAIKSLKLHQTKITCIKAVPK